MDVLAIIPARGGSKGVLKKNIRELCGKPLIAYTIEEAKKCRSISRIIVTTDDPDIAETSVKFGAEVPFVRPAELSNDTATTIDVIVHSLEWLEKNEEYRPDAVMLLQPTSPLRTWEDMDKAFKIFQTNPGMSVISVCEAEHSPFWCGTIEDGRLVPIGGKDYTNIGRQGLPKAYRFNGAIYISSRKDILTERTFFNNINPYIMPCDRSIDIDTELDLKFAEFILRENIYGK